MTPQQRAALIARAKSLAIPVASCVAARLRPDHLLRDASRDELAALVIVLAEAADPVVLREVVKAQDDGARPAPAPPGPRVDGRRNADRVKDYAVLRVGGYGIGEAAERTGVTRRTAERYEAALAAAGQAPWRESEAVRAA